MVGFLAPLLGAIGGWAGSAVGQTVIGAGASLLSAKMGQPKNKWQVPDYAGIRSKAEAAGFNPLTALTSASGQAVQSQNYMGAAIADAGLMLADTLAKNKNAGQVSKLAQSNAALTKKVQALTLRPVVGGVYAQRQATPSLRSSLRVSGSALSSSGSGVSDVSTVGADPRLADPVVLLDGPSGGIAVPPDRLDRGAGFYIAGRRIEPAPGWSPSNVAENEYGDIGQAFYGLGKLGADLAYTVSLRPGQTRGRPLSMRDGIEMPPGYRPSYPKSKADRVSDYVGPPPRDAWPKFELGSGKGWGRPRKYPFGPYAD